MDEKLQKEVFEYIKDAAAKISDFAAKEVPPLISEFLTWKFWEAGFYVGCWTLVLLVWTAAVGTYYFKRKEHIKKDMADEGFAFIMIGVFSFGLAIVLPLFCGVMDDMITMIQISIAPKVYLLQEAKNFLQ